MRLLQFVKQNGCIWRAISGLCRAIGFCEILSKIHKYQVWGEVNKRALKMAPFLLLFYNNISNILMPMAGNSVIIHIISVKSAEEEMCSQLHCRVLICCLWTNICSALKYHPDVSTTPLLLTNFASVAGAAEIGDNFLQLRHSTDWNISVNPPLSVV